MLELLLIVGLAAGEEPPGERSTSVRAEMHERFTRATLIQTALINGNLDGARHWARQLADMAPDSPAFADLRSRFATLADAVVRSETLAGAANQAGQLANACGACHELHAVGSDRFESATTPSGSPGTQERMARHIWAADRLWEGLIGRSESAWTAGADALMTDPLMELEASAANRQADALLGETRALGREALETARWEARASLYGQLLATCSRCHARYRETGAQ